MQMQSQEHGLLATVVLAYWEIQVVLIHVHVGEVLEILASYDIACLELSSNNNHLSLPS